MITFRCPECNREARANDEHAGKKAKCPGCGAVFQIPAEGGAAKPASKAVAPAKPKSSPAARAEPPRPPAKAAARSRPPVDEEDDEDFDDVEAAEEEEDDDNQDDFDFDKPSKKKGKSRGKSRGKKSRSGRKGRPGAWAPCPSCGSDDATQQHFTWWGGFIGPMIINTVRCNDCGTTYNGIHGDSNTNRILIYCLVPLAIVIVFSVICGVLGALGEAL